MNFKRALSPTFSGNEAVCFLQFLCNNYERTVVVSWSVVVVVVVTVAVSFTVTVTGPASVVDDVRPLAPPFGLIVALGSPPFLDEVFVDW